MAILIFVNRIVLRTISEVGFQHPFVKWDQSLLLAVSYVRDAERFRSAAWQHAEPKAVSGRAPDKRPGRQIAQIPQVLEIPALS